MTNYGDIAKINGAEVPPVNVITFGSPCFPAGTLILTDKGLTEIEDIRAGDKVLTHKGRYRVVTATGHKKAETITLKGNIYGLTCTPNHPIYRADKVRNSYTENGKYRRVYRLNDAREWTVAADMKNHLWAVPNTFETLPITPPRCEHPNEKPMPPFGEDLFYFVGRWIGDGWVRDGERSDRKGKKYAQIIICAGYKKEAKLKAAVEKITNRYSVEHCRTVVKYIFCHKAMCNWLVENFGKYAYGKRLPSWALSMPREWRQALMQGIFDTDGYCPDENHVTLTTVSEKLAFGLRLMSETLGYSTSLRYCPQPGIHIIEGRVVRQRAIYRVLLTKPTTKGKLQDELHSWYPVKEIKSTGQTTTVYNLTVDEDNSYIADSIVVHNCQDLSLDQRDRRICSCCDEKTIWRRGG